MRTVVGQFSRFLTYRTDTRRIKWISGPYRYPGSDEQDDEYLMSEGSMNKPTYGSLPPSDFETGPNFDSRNRFGSGLLGSVGILLHRLRLLQTRIPGLSPWRDPGEPSVKSGLVVTKMVGVFYIFVLLFDILVVCDINYMDGSSSAALFFILTFLACIVVILILISKKPQCR